MSIVCFYLEQVQPVRMRRWLRVYADGPCPKMPGQYGYHNAKFLLGDFDGETDEQKERPSLEDERWPKTCECGHVFDVALKETKWHQWQLFSRYLYRRTDIGEVLTLHEAPDGAMWFADWMSDSPEYKGPDGRTLVVRVPRGHDWIVDSRASNCGSPNDNVHKCWVRHGTPPKITVDQNGNTCVAGGGSIQTKEYHGKLIDGVLIPC